MRNYGEFGINLQKIVSRLMNNDNLIKLLYYQNTNPLGEPSLTEEQKRQLIYNKLIRIIPKVNAKETSQSILTIEALSGDLNTNKEFIDITISIEIFVPFNQWIIENSNLRQFLIMGEIQNSLNNKTVNGLGKLYSDGFKLAYLTEDLACYEMNFNITEYA